MAKHCLTRAKMHEKDNSKKMIVKNKTIRVLLDSGLSEDLLFMKKGASKNILVIRRTTPQSWGTSNGTFVTDKVSEVKIVFIDFSCSNQALEHLCMTSSLAKAPCMI
jgi:hypothetical protein